jgi:hypothetical protein
MTTSIKERWRKLAASASSVFPCISKKFNEKYEGYGLAYHKSRCVLGLAAFLTEHSVWLSVNPSNSGNAKSQQLLPIYHVGK